MTVSGNCLKALIHCSPCVPYVCLTSFIIVVMTTIMSSDKTTITDPFGRLLNLARSALVHRLTSNFRSLGYDITAEQWRVLMILWHKDGQTQQELSEQAGKDKGNITRMISNLEKKNILVRIPNHADGRSKLIYLTKKGMDCRKALNPIVNKTLKEAQESIPKEEMELCKSVLKKVFDNLNR